MASTSLPPPLELSENQTNVKGYDAGEKQSSFGRGRMLSLVTEEAQWKEETSKGEESFMDKTLVDDAAASTLEGTSKGATSDRRDSKSIPPSPPKQDMTLSDEPWDITKWNPSRKSNSRDGTTVIDEEQDTSKMHGRHGKEEDIGDTKLSQLLDPATTAGGEQADATRELDLGPTPSFSVSRRPSGLLAQHKAPSPQPWDLIHPPDDNMNERTLPDSVAYKLPASGSGHFASAQLTSTGRRLIPKSSYYSGPPPSDTAYGTPPMGHIGVHHPREILRVERDYTGGEVIQFAPIYPLELEGRLTPTQFLESINSINELLISAHSLRHAFLDNVVTLMSLQLSRLVMSTHFEKELKKLRSLIGDLNERLFNPVGLNILWPGDNAFQFLEIEYY